MAKPFGVKHATTILEKYSKKAPKDRDERQEIIDVLRRLPTDVDDALVEAALVHDIRDGGVDNSQADCLLTAIPAGGTKPNPARWAHVVVRAMKKFAKDADAAFYLAALPADDGKWVDYMVRLDTVRGGLRGFWNPNGYTPELRERVIRRLASDPDVVAGARAAAKLSKPSMYEGWWWILAADGSAKSLPLLEAFIAAHGPADWDWLANLFAPLMITEHTAALRARLIAAVKTRTAPGLEAARAMGIETKALKFKVGIYAKGGMPRIRAWIDSTKDPWFDARWNWDELVTTPKTPKRATPLEGLRLFLRSCVDDGKGEFVTWELQTAHRGDDKAKLVAFLSAELKGLKGPNPASAPLKSFRG